MFKWVFLLNSFLIISFCFSQTVSTVKQLLLQNKLIEAKTEVENLLSIPDSANNANAWYFKGFIYNIISKDSSIQLPLTNPKAIAFNAFMKCLQIAPNHKWLHKDNYAPLFDIYVNFFESGKKDLTLSNYNNALENFLNAEKVKNYIYTSKIKYKNFEFSELDTGLVFNIAFCAEKVGKIKETIHYTKKLADTRLKEPMYLPLYHKLVDYYISIYDEIGFRKYLSIGRSLFPYDQYWIQAEVDMTKAGKLSDALVKDYLSKLKDKPNDFNLSYQFAADLLNILYNAESTVKKFDEWFPLLEQNVEQCLQLQKTGIKAESLASFFHYKEALRTNIDDTATHKKNHFIKSAIFAETVYADYEKNNRLSRNELDAFKTVSKRLIEIHTYTGEVEKVKQLEQKHVQIENLLPVYIPKKKQ